MEIIRIKRLRYITVPVGVVHIGRLKRRNFSLDYHIFITYKFIDQQQADIKKCDTKLGWFICCR